MGLQREVVRQWRLMGTGQRSFASGSGGAAEGSAKAHNKYALTGEYAPVYIVLGFVSVAVGIAIHTAKQQLFHFPGVHVSKKRRELFPEIELPDSSIANGDKFIKKSFLRKVAHIQHSPSPSNPFTRPRQAETLKSVGVNPRAH